MAIDLILPSAVFAGAPGALEQLVANERIPFGPILATGGPHHLRGVIVAVVIMDIRQVSAHGEAKMRVLGVVLVAQQVFQPAFHFLALVNSGAVERGDAGRSARESDRSACRRVLKAAVVLAAF